jgi:hypothetical protein
MFGRAGERMSLRNSEASKRNWQNPEYRSKMLVLLANRPAMTNPELARERRYKQLEHECAEAKKLEEQGYEVFSPTVVCDRIAVKDGKVYFVEFKKIGQSLRPGQKRIHDLMPENYRVVFSS